jgi:hypothetical protein
MKHRPWIQNRHFTCWSRSLGGAAALLIGIAAHVGCTQDAAEGAEASVDCDGSKCDGPGAGTGRLLVNSHGDVPVKIKALRQTDEGSPPRFELESGVPMELASGDYCVWTEVITGPSDFYPHHKLGEDCTVVVESRKTTTYELGNVTFTRGTRDLVFGIDMRMYPYDADDDEEVYKDDSRVYFFLKEGAIPHVAGEFDYSYAAFNSMHIRVEQGVNTSIDLTNPTGAPTVRIRRSTGHTLPDGATPVFCVRSESHWGDHRCGAGNSSRSIVFHSSDVDDEEVSLEHNEIWTWGTTKFPSVVRLKRLNVDHVPVERWDGTIEMVPGEASVWNDATGATLFAHRDTGFGYDVFPGRYRITTEYIHPADHSRASVTNIVEL